MNYLDYKKLESKVLKSGSIQALVYLQKSCLIEGGVISSQLASYKYNLRDLSKEELSKLYTINGLHDNDYLVGGDVYKRLGRISTKEVVLTKVYEIDLFKILQQIQYIVESRGSN